MIVDIALYTDGRRDEGKLPLEDALEACVLNHGFVWVRLDQPTPAEFEAVRREFELHDLAVEDAIMAHQRPKLDVYGETLFLVLKTLQSVPEEEVVDTGEIMLFVNPQFVVSVRHGQSSALDAVRRRLEAEPRLLARGPAAVLYGALDQVVDDYGPIAERLDRAVEAIEIRVFSTGRDNPAGRIYHLEREVLELHRAVGPLGAALDRLLKGPFPMIDDDLHAYLVDVHDHQLLTAGRVEGFRGLLDSLLQANLAQVSLQQNADMRKISSWVAILAVPTMLAGIYGMNFETMPELGWRYGYPAVLVLMLTICTALWFRFRRVGWL